MKSRKESKWLGFLLGMVIYALVVVLIASVGLKFLWDYADEYEKALPAHRMTAYLTTLNETHVKKISVNFVASLDHNIQSDDDAYAEIWKCFVAGVNYRRLTSDSEANTITYEIFNKEHTLGTVTLTRNPDRTGERSWSVTAEDYDFSFLLRSETFVVPEHWVVKCGDKRLGVQYIVNPRVEYSFLSDFYGKSFPMPFLAEYEIRNYIGDPKIRYFDADGDEHARFTFTDGKDQMLRGGISDPRNKAIMKMLNLISIGERAGSGVPDIYSVWENKGWNSPVVEEQYGPDRTILTLVFAPKQAEKASGKGKRK